MEKMVKDDEVRGKFPPGCVLIGSNRSAKLVDGSLHKTLLRNIYGKHKTAQHIALCWAVLVPDPTNPFDPESVMVLLDEGWPIGYVSNIDTEDFRKEIHRLRFDYDQTVVCRATICSNEEDGDYIGIWLDIGTEDVATFIEQTASQHIRRIRTTPQEVWMMRTRETMNGNYSAGTKARFIADNPIGPGDCLVMLEDHYTTSWAKSHCQNITDPLEIPVLKKPNALTVFQAVLNKFKLWTRRASGF